LHLQRFQRQASSTWGAIRCVHYHRGIKGSFKNIKVAGILPFVVTAYIDTLDTRSWLHNECELRNNVTLNYIWNMTEERCSSCMD
jgi:hypothetical protein